MVSTAHVEVAHDVDATGSSLVSRDDVRYLDPGPEQLISGTLATLTKGIEIQRGVPVAATLRGVCRSLCASLDRSLDQRYADDPADLLPQMPVDFAIDARLTEFAAGRAVNGNPELVGHAAIVIEHRRGDVLP